MPNGSGEAQVVIKALDLLHTASKGDYSVLKTSLTSFHPRKFYEYAWICLKGGQGVRAWRNPQPPMPSPGPPVADQGQVFYHVLNEKMVVEKWHQGDLLETPSGKLTLNDIWPDTSDTVTLEIATKGEKVRREKKDKNAKTPGLEGKEMAKGQKGKQVQKDNDIGLQCTGRLTVDGFLSSWEPAG